MAVTCFPESGLLIILSVSVVLAMLPVPKNVRVTSINMGVVLEWDTTHPSSSNHTYTAEYRTSGLSRNFSTVCQDQTALRCDFTAVIVPYGIYTFRVRTESQGNTSRWARSAEFFPDRDTWIGAPAVKLTSTEGNIRVDIQNPVMKVKTLGEIYSRVAYHIRYWKQGKEGEVTVMNDMEQPGLLLNQLEDWSKYCVQAQVFIKHYNKSGEPSKATCETTTTDGKVEPREIAVVLVVSFLVVTVTVPLLFLMAWRCYRVLKFLFPTAKLPEHLKQYLMEPPHPWIFLVMQNSSQLEEQCHEVSIISESPLLEGERLCGHTEEQRGMMEGEEEQSQNENREVDKMQ
ncbi:hypothetical protein AAFF_G00167450 [Aldrovandia affinis]|uniref:Fibronectin type-III domain-containing protein n=1 Tax=Aldrovandia affinis TaxID=143900 RepID=A0AAD7RPV1_9TELE|nr:hypothetical protein AAFF_G00167450 [Aldrovandia affinis]